MILIGLAGRAGCGKDTIANFLMETHGFVQIALADVLRDGLKAMLGITDEQIYRRDLKEQTIDWIGRSPRELMPADKTPWPVLDGVSPLERKIMAAHAGRAQSLFLKRWVELTRDHH